MHSLCLDGRKRNQENGFAEFLLRPLFLTGELEVVACSGGKSFDLICDQIQGVLYRWRRNNIYNWQVILLLEGDAGDSLVRKLPQYSDLIGKAGSGCGAKEPERRVVLVTSDLDFSPSVNGQDVDGLALGDKAFSYEITADDLRLDWLAPEISGNFRDDLPWKELNHEERAEVANRIDTLRILFGERMAEKYKALESLHPASRQEGLPYRKWYKDRLKDLEKEWGEYCKIDERPVKDFIRARPEAWLRKRVSVLFGLRGFGRQWDLFLRLAPRQSIAERRDLGMAFALSALVSIADRSLNDWPHRFLNLDFDWDHAELKNKLSLYAGHLEHTRRYLQNKMDKDPEISLPRLSADELCRDGGEEEFGFDGSRPLQIPFLYDPGQDGQLRKWKNTIARQGEQKFGRLRRTLDARFRQTRLPGVGRNETTIRDFEEEQEFCDDAVEEATRNASAALSKFVSYPVWEDAATKSLVENGENCLRRRPGKISIACLLAFCFLCLPVTAFFKLYFLENSLDGFGILFSFVFLALGFLMAFLLEKRDLNRLSRRLSHHLQAYEGSIQTWFYTMSDRMKAVCRLGVAQRNRELFGNAFQALQKDRQRYRYHLAKIQRHLNLCTSALCALWISGTRPVIAPGENHKSQKLMENEQSSRQWFYTLDGREERQTFSLEYLGAMQPDQEGIIGSLRCIRLTKDKNFI